MFKELLEHTNIELPALDSKLAIKRNDVILEVTGKFIGFDIGCIAVRKNNGILSRIELVKIGRIKDMNEKIFNPILIKKALLQRQISLLSYLSGFVDSKPVILPTRKIISLEVKKANHPAFSKRMKMLILISVSYAGYWIYFASIFRNKF